MSKKNFEFCNLRSPDFTTYLHPLPNYFDLNFLTNSFPNGMHFFFFNEPICWVQIQKIQGVSGSRQKELSYLKEQKRTKAESRHGVQRTLVNEFGQLWPHFARSVQAMEWTLFPLILRLRNRFLAWVPVSFRQWASLWSEWPSFLLGINVQEELTRAARLDGWRGRC